VDSGHFKYQLVGINIEPESPACQERKLGAMNPDLAHPQHACAGA
jgi:hypothetical protein